MGNILISRKMVQNWIGELGAFAQLKAYRAARVKNCVNLTCSLAGFRIAIVM